MCTHMNVYVDIYHFMGEQVIVMIEIHFLKVYFDHWSLCCGKYNNCYRTGMIHLHSCTDLYRTGEYTTGFVHSHGSKSGSFWVYFVLVSELECCIEMVGAVLCFSLAVLCVALILGTLLCVYRHGCKISAYKSLLHHIVNVHGSVYILEFMTVILISFHNSKFKFAVHVIPMHCRQKSWSGCPQHV